MDSSTRRQFTNLAGKIHDLYFETPKAGEHIESRLIEFGQCMKKWSDDKGADNVCPWPWKNANRAKYYQAHRAEFLSAQYMLAVMIHDYIFQGSRILSKSMLLKKRFQALDYHVPGAAISILRCCCIWPDELPRLFSDGETKNLTLSDLDELFLDIQKDLEKHIGEDIPKDCARLYVICKDYQVSRASIKRAIADGRIKSYRSKNAPKNSPHSVSRKEVEKFWPKRK